MQLCDYGCGREARYQLKNGKWCCSKPYQKCPSVRKINSESKIGMTGFWKGKKFSISTKRKMSIAKLGKSNHMYGKKHLFSTKQEISEGLKQFFKNETSIQKDERISKMEEVMGSPDMIEKNRNSQLRRFRDKREREKISKSTLGRIPHNKRTIDKIQKEYPVFFKVEKMRYNPNKPGEKEIQVHCKNNNCRNSKEKNGWFTPELWQLTARIRAIEKPEGFGESNFYCSENCKRTCRLFNKSVAQLIKEDQITAGYIPEEQYTSEEYNTWREEVFKRADYKCEYCGEKATHCHHGRPQKLEPFFSLDPDWGIATCSKCHYKYGHPAGTECSTGQLANVICIEKTIKGDK